MATAVIVDKNTPNSKDVKWIVVYPSYIDAKKTVQQGRKLVKSQAVETPTCQEIYDVLQATGLNPKLEPLKFYPRDNSREFEGQGRVRVQLKNDDGTPRYKDYPTRKLVYKYVAEMIPKLKTRQPGYVPPPAPGTSGNKKNKKKK